MKKFLTIFGIAITAVFVAQAAPVTSEKESDNVFRILPPDLYKGLHKEPGNENGEPPSSPSDQTLKESAYCRQLRLKISGPHAPSVIPDTYPDGQSQKDLSRRHSSERLLNNQVWKSRNSGNIQSQPNSNLRDPRVELENQYFRECQ